MLDAGTTVQLALGFLVSLLALAANFIAFLWRLHQDPSTTVWD